MTKDFDLSHEEISDGIVDGEHDGGIDSVFTFVNGDLIYEDTDLTSYKKNVEIELIIIQSKTSGGFSEDPLNAALASLSKLLDLEQDLEQLSQYNDGVKRGIELFRGAYRSLASKFPKLSISFVYAAMSAVQSPHENTQKKMDDLVRLLESLFDEARVRTHSQ